MDESTGKRQKWYVDFSTNESKTYLIHYPGHYSNECNFLGDFGTKYAKGNPNKNHGNNPVQREKIKRQQENNALINNAADEILLYETKRVNAVIQKAP